MTEMLVRCYQQLVPILLRPVEQRTVVQARPTAFENSSYLMPRQIPTQRHRYTLIEQYSQGTESLRSRVSWSRTLSELPTLHTGKPA